MARTPAVPAPQTCQILPGPARFGRGEPANVVVHNAAGMVWVQEGISVTEGLIRLRAFAFSSDRLLADVAEDVAARRLGLGGTPLVRRWRGTGRYYDGCHGPRGRSGARRL